jgi:hypothetical protein
MRPPTKFETGKTHILREFTILVQHPFEDLKKLSEELVVRTWKNQYNSDGLQVMPQAIDWTLDMDLLTSKSVGSKNCGCFQVQIPWGEDFERFSLGYQKRNKPETYVSIVENIRESFFSKGEKVYSKVFYGPEDDSDSSGSIRATTPLQGKGRWHPAKAFTEAPNFPAIYLWRCEIPAHFEMHSHVQSNHCAPFPAVWLHAWDNTLELHGIKPGYWGQDKILGLPLFGKGEMADISTQSTEKIIDQFVSQFKTAGFEAAFPFLSDSPDQVACLLPMDFEYMHFDGYFGIPISKEVRSTRYSSGRSEIVRWYCWNKIWEFLTNNSAVPGRPDLPMIYRENPPSKRGECWSWMDSDANETYEPWSRQSESYRNTPKFDDTNNRSMSHFPLQHFDPRRYRQITEPTKLDSKPSEYGEAGFSALLADPIQAASSGSFYGYKLYTTLGWAPMDPFLRDPLERFYAHCQDNQIPLINHGTPAGFYTHDRRYYLDLLLEHDKTSGDHKVVDGTEDGFDGNWMTGFSREITGPDGNACHAPSRKERSDVALGGFYHPDPACSWWYIHHYVSPRAWKKVVEKYPRLKLDLAHYGDSDHFLDRSWDKRKDREPKSMSSKTLNIAFDGKKIDPHRTHRFLYDLIDLIQPENQVFADLSYVILNEHNAGVFADLFEWARENKPVLLERVLWGTDWPLVGDEAMVKPLKPGNMLFRYAHGFHEALPSLPADFFIRACFLNPLQFLDLASIRQKLKNRKRRMNPWPWIEDLDPKLFQMDATNPDLQHIDKAALFYQTHKGLV